MSNKLHLTAFHRSLITLTFFSGVFISHTAIAQIRSDPSAPGNQRPTVLLAPNGVPLVNIQTPSAAGVSRNTYSQFDVQPNGAILNNSRTDTSTQLGGWVQANPWLATGSARVILNEVNSSNPSHLNGWVEVAGTRAQVVVANPAGISCNGCGFINSSTTTLATGTPIVHKGSLESYHIPAGQLRIEGLGLDARETNVITILARSAEVNAAIWAQRLKVITGKNDVSVDANGEVTTITPVLPPPLIITPIPGSYPGRSTGSPPPAFALDTAYLGGMYAGHIFIVGTEHGLGTRNLGTFRANQEFIFNANGWLDVKGSISAPKLTVESEQLTNRGLITGQTVSVNNYLSHSEAQAREKALQQKQACTTDECRQAAQKTINELNQLDTWRDAQIQTACTSPSSSLCQGLTSALQIAKASYTNYDLKADINGSVAGERSQVNSRSESDTR